MHDVRTMQPVGSNIENEAEETDKKQETGLFYFVGGHEGPQRNLKIQIQCLFQILFSHNSFEDTDYFFTLA